MSTSGVNKLGTDWLRIDAWLKEQLAMAHAEMEGGLSVEEYHRVVGKAQLIRNLQTWVVPVKMEEIQEDDYGISSVEDGKY